MQGCHRRYTKKTAEKEGKDLRDLRVTGVLKDKGIYAERRSKRDTTKSCARGKKFCMVYASIRVERKYVPAQGTVSVQDTIIKGAMTQGLHRLKIVVYRKTVKTAQAQRLNMLKNVKNNALPVLRVIRLKDTYRRTRRKARPPRRPQPSRGASFRYRGGPRAGNRWGSWPRAWCTCQGSSRSRPPPGAPA